MRGNHILDCQRLDDFKERVRCDAARDSFEMVCVRGVRVQGALVRGMVGLSWSGQGFWHSFGNASA